MSTSTMQMRDKTEYPHAVHMVEAEQLRLESFELMKEAVEGQLPVAFALTCGMPRSQGPLVGA